MHPRKISITNYQYQLPEERIPAYPLSERDAARLLIYRNGLISEDVYRNLSSHLPSNSILVFNNTRVVPARLLFQKESGGVIEIFCLEPDEQYSDVSTALASTGKVLWRCLVGGASKWKHGMILEKSISQDSINIMLRAQIIDRASDHFIIELSWSPASISFAEILQFAGAVPLPPYMKRESEASDNERYQTVYAEPPGSVAAPTAGLHFTASIFESLRQKEIQSLFLTLHVGAGTFKPVKAEHMEDHIMHAEWIDVSRETIESLASSVDRTIIAVGTTSLRTLESLYWIGARIIFHPGIDPGPLSQWEPYVSETNATTRQDALNAILGYLKEKKLDRLMMKTSILIAPGYTPRMADALVTNFHQPGSTLLLLVAALIGEDWRKVYDFALENGFRFLSYGDGSLLWIKKN